MFGSKTKKRYIQKIFQRKSLLLHFKSKHHLYLSYEKFRRKSHIRRFFRSIHRTYCSLCFTATLIIRLFALIDQISRDVFLFIENFIRIIEVIYGWIQMIQAVLKFFYLIVHRLMLIVHSFHQICYLFSILFQPISNRTFEKSIKSVSNFFFYYYSSNGACYTLKDRTRHIVGKVRERWQRKTNNDDGDIYYDAFDDNNEWY